MRSWRNSQRGLKIEVVFSLSNYCEPRVYHFVKLHGHIIPLLFSSQKKKSFFQLYMQTSKFCGRNGDKEVKYVDFVDNSVSCLRF